jgi:hypothetical protein
MHLKKCNFYILKFCSYHEYLLLIGFLCIIEYYICKSVDIK